MVRGRPRRAAPLRRRRAAAHRRPAAGRVPSFAARRRAARSISARVRGDVAGIAGAAMTCRHGRRAAIETVFLDAGGVLVHPNWTRVAEALAATAWRPPPRGSPRPSRTPSWRWTPGALMARTDDRQRGWIYFDAVLRHAGVAADDATDRAPWPRCAPTTTSTTSGNTCPPTSCRRSRRCGRSALRLVVVSNANGTAAPAVRPCRPDAAVRRRARLARVGRREARSAAVPPGAGAKRRRRPATTMHVGDFFHIDVVGARAAGLADAVLFDIGAISMPTSTAPRVSPARRPAFGYAGRGRGNSGPCSRARRRQRGRLAARRAQAPHRSWPRPGTRLERPPPS